MLQRRQYGGQQVDGRARQVDRVVDVELARGATQVDNRALTGQRMLAQALHDLDDVDFGEVAADEHHPRRRVRGQAQSGDTVGSFPDSEAGIFQHGGDG
jgi:hypothetical protein